MRAQDSEKAQDRANPRVPVTRIAAAVVTVNREGDKSFD